MADYTENFNLKKPARTDKFSIADFNENMDKIDSAIKENGGGGGGNAPSEAVVYCDPAPETVIAQVNSTNIDLSDPTLWEQGNIDEDGSDLNSTSIIRTKELIPINPLSMGLIFTSSVKNGKAREYAVVCFDENRSPIINGTWTWTKSGTAMYFDSGVHFVRIEDSYVQAATCSPADILTANLMILEE